MSKKEPPPNIDKMYETLTHYEGMHELTEEEQKTVAVMSMMFYPADKDNVERSMYVVMVRALFNCGYEAGQKARPS